LLTTGIETKDSDAKTQEEHILEEERLNAERSALIQRQLRVYQGKQPKFLTRPTLEDTESMILHKGKLKGIQEDTPLDGARTVGRSRIRLRNRSPTPPPSSAADGNLPIIGTTLQVEDENLEHRKDDKMLKWPTSKTRRREIHESSSADQNFLPAMNPNFKPVNTNSHPGHMQHGIFELFSPPAELDISLGKTDKVHKVATTMSEPTGGATSRNPYRNRTHSSL
jgi:hypothetical protein